jgi:hypothetical protein
MNDIQTTVVSKIIGEKDGKAARAGVLPGKHPVDFTVRFHGTMNVGEDYERMPTTSIPWLEVTTLYREVFRRAINELVEKIDEGHAVTRSDLTSMGTAGVLTTGVLVDCIRTALENGKSAVGTVEDRVKEVEAGIEALKKELVSKAPSQKVPGKVTLDVSSDVVGVPQDMTAEQVAEAVGVGVFSVAEIGAVEAHRA